MVAGDPSSGQEAVPTNPEAVVVTGRRVADDARTRALVRAVTPDAGFAAPLARFADPVCFGVTGLPHPIIAAIATRMAYDAGEAGLRLAGDRCRPNVVVMFVGDGAAEMTRLEERRPGFFDSLDLSEVRHLVREPGPVHAVMTRATRSRDGDPIHVAGAVGTPMLEVPTASHLDLPIRRDIERSVLFIDRASVEGMSSTQLADYAAMRTLAVVRPDHATGGDTILALFAARAEPVATEATAFDRGYLKALYAGASNRRGIMKIEEIARDITRGQGR